MFSQDCSSACQALAELKSVKSELKQREDLIHVLTTDRDRAIATLKQRGLTIDHSSKVRLFSSRCTLGDATCHKSPGNLHFLFSEFQAHDDPDANADVVALQQQNDNLRAVIARMREEMETLGTEFPNNQRQSSCGKHDSVTTGQHDVT